MGRTRLSRWLLQRQALVLLLASVLVLGICLAVVNRSFDGIERDRVQELLNRSAGMLQTSSQAMLSSTRDYAAWDDSFRFIRSGEAAYLRANFAPSAMANLGVDWVAFLRPDGSLMAGLHVDEGKSDQALDPAIVRAIAAALPLRAGPGAGVSGSALAWIDGQPTLLAFSAISNSDQSAQAGAWLAFGRHLTGPSHTQTDWRLGLPFAIEPLAAGARLPTQARWDGGAWVGRLALPPWPATLVLRQPPAYGAQRTALLRSLFLGIGALTVLAITALALLLRHKVLHRLEGFAALADVSVHEKGETPRWPVAGSDELDALAGALNAMMERIEQQEADLAYLASHDPLTNLGNRRQLMASLHMAIGQRERQAETNACLLLLDLDRFKTINDSLGHSAGDQVLSVVADRILSTLRQGDLVVRLGGDEFALLLSGIRPDQVSGLCERLLVRVAHSIPYQDRLLFTTASIGIAWIEAGLSEHELLRRADHAMYRAKQGGRNRAEGFEPGLDG